MKEYSLDDACDDCYEGVCLVFWPVCQVAVLIVLLPFWPIGYARRKYFDWERNRPLPIIEDEDDDNDNS